MSTTSLPTIDSTPAAASAVTSPTPSFSPLYQQIKGLILNGLRLGEWKPGEVIPSEMDLATRFHVSQGTVRKAIDELAAENLLVRRQGKGTFVATHAEQQVQFRFLKLVPDCGTPGSEGPAQRDIIECRRTRASVTSTPHFSQMMPRNFMRLYLPHRHSQSVTGPKMRAQNRPSRSGLKVR